MGYSRSIVTLERRLSLLSGLLEQDECVWETEPKNERLLAYQIREALAVAKTVGATKYPEYAAAAADFKIQETGTGKIIARRRRHFVTTKVGYKVMATTDDVLESFDADNPFSSVKILNASAHDLTDLAEFVKSQGFLLFWDIDTNLATFKPFSDELEPLAFAAEDLE